MRRSCAHDELRLLVRRLKGVRLIRLRSNWIKAYHPVETSERRTRCTVHLLASSAKRSWTRTLPQ